MQQLTDQNIDSLIELCKEFLRLLDEMKAKGLIEEFIENGQKKYRLTTIGRAFYLHASSNPKTRN